MMENTENMTEEEYHQHRSNHIKNTYTEDDFLSCNITRDRLYNEFIWEWEKTAVPNIEEFYNYVRVEEQSMFATPLFHDKDGSFSTTLTGIVFKNIREKYDISVFHDCPDLAKPLISQYSEIQDRKKDGLKRKKMVSGEIVEASTTFSWGDKTHK